jgi:L-iditol 2-dehydrogenase
LKQSIDVAARCGQVLYFAATLEPQVTLDLDLIHYKELRLVGSFDSTIAQHEQALVLLSAGTITVKPLISHRLPLEQAPEGYEIARNQQGLKVLIVHQGAQKDPR